MNKHPLIFLILLAFSSVCLAPARLPVFAQTIASGDLTRTPTVTTYRDAIAFAGPGISHPVRGTLYAGVEAQIIGRTRAGNWVHIQQMNAAGAVLLDGWIISGYLNDADALRFSQILVEDVPDGDPTTGGRADLAELNVAPVISPLTGERLAAVQEIFARGQVAGNLPHVVTKIGDSLSADPLYLERFALPGTALDPYDHLADTLAFYREGVGASVAARVGMTSYVVFDPMWSDPAGCEAGETPLACELRIRRPSVAFIMFGSNDVARMTDEEFAVQLRLIAEEVAAFGTIPVLSTFSYHPENDLWPQSVNFNRQIVRLADDLHLPLINLWSAARPLPDYGLDVDHIHMLHDGFEPLTLGGGGEAFYGATLRDLLSLAMLAEIRTVVGAESTPLPS